MRAATYLHAHSAKTTPQLVHLAPQIAAYDHAAAAELAKLLPPPSIESEWKQIVAAIDTSADGTAKYGEYAAVKDLQAIQKLLPAANQLQQRIERIAMRNGVTQCSLAF